MSRWVVVRHQGPAPYWRRGRLRYYARRLRCLRNRHPWGRWRRETEEWFEYVDAPLPWAWRSCQRCRTMEWVRPEVAVQR